MVTIKDVDSEEDQYLENVVDEINDLDKEQETMSEVEVRLEEANYLKAILRNSLFADSDSVIAQRVEKRIRDFIKQELKILLGMDVRKETVEVRNSFTEDEEKVLKALASKVLNKGKENSSSEPTVNITTVSSQPSPKLVVTQTKVAVPELKRTANNATKTEVKTKKTKKREQYIEKELEIQGEVKMVQIDVTQQTTPVGYRRKSQEEMNAIIQGQAMQTAPMGMLQQFLGSEAGKIKLIDEGEQQ